MQIRRRLCIESLESRRVLTAVDVPDNLTGEAAAEVDVPINIDNALGIRAAEIRVDYDASVLDIAENDIVAGTVWSGDSTVEVIANVDEAAGTIVVSVFGTENLPAGNGTLVNFQFTIRAGVNVGTSTVIDVTEVRLNEGAITLVTNPQPGADATDGLIRVTAESSGDSISGTVYADVNTNNTPDATEGVPGVTITLLNTTTNAQIQTTTGSDGRYQFTGLTPGSYVIRERQPAAYLDGGVNEISIGLSAGQDLVGQNFRELGLGPAFIYSRLLTTLVMPVGSESWISAIARINADAESTALSSLASEPTSNLPEGEGSVTSDTAVTETHNSNVDGGHIETRSVSEGEAAIRRTLADASGYDQSSDIDVQYVNLNNPTLPVPIADAIAEGESQIFDSVVTTWPSTSVNETSVMLVAESDEVIEDVVGATIIGKARESEPIQSISIAGLINDNEFVESIMSAHDSSAEDASRQKAIHANTPLREILIPVDGTQFNSIVEENESIVKQGLEVNDLTAIDDIFSEFADSTAVP